MNGLTGMVSPEGRSWESPRDPFVETTCDAKCKLPRGFAASLRGGPIPFAGGAEPLPARQGGCLGNVVWSAARVLSCVC